LYVPEIQKLFRLDKVIARTLKSAELDPVSVAAGESITDIERNAQELISLIIRDNEAPPLSESRHQHQELRDVVVHVSQRCNLNCVYCYATDLNKVNQTMQPETADVVVRETMMLAAHGLSCVKFLGGEPTLAWPIIERLMTGYVNASRATGVKPPSFTMVTNGTRMTAAMISCAARYQMHVLVSVDGPQEIHDLLRPSHGGSGSYTRATMTLKALAEAGVEVAVESVYTRQHYLAGITPQMMIEHFLSLGVRQFQISPTVGVWHDSDTIEQNSQITGLFVEAARKSVQSFRTTNPYLLRGIKFVLDGFALRERLRYVCGAGRTFMGINYDGEAFPCYLLESPDTSYGLLGRTFNRQRYDAVRDRFVHNGKEYHPVCRECWANEICQSCLGTSWQITPDVTKPPAWFCQFQKALIGVVLAEIGSARDSSDWEVFLQSMRQHLQPLAA
jgi:uncharacterized protein